MDRKEVAQRVAVNKECYAAAAVVIRVQKNASVVCVRA
jgi:hypothetical protein